jgi:O-antigen ligase
MSPVIATTSGANVLPEEFQDAHLAQRVGQRTGPLEMAAAVACSVAIAAVPVVSFQESYSIIGKVLALMAAAFAAMTLFKRVPKLHPAMLAYFLLVLFFGFRMVHHPDVWEEYNKLLKVCLLALASHVVFRTQKQIVLLFAIYSSAALITLTLNWGELAAFHESGMMSSSEGAIDRFAGTLQNANATGMYGITAMLSAMIAFSRMRGFVRWLVLLVGVLSGLGLAYYSGSRKAMIGIGALSLVMPWIVVRARKAGSVPWSRRIVLFAMLVPVAALILTNLPNSERLLRLFSESDVGSYSGEVRYEMFWSSLRLWRQRPFIGHGYDGFARLSGFGVYSHTTYGELLCNGGLIGLGLISVFYCSPIREMVRLVRSPLDLEKRPLHTGLLTFLVLFAFFSCFAVLFGTRDYISICAAICGYLAASRPSEQSPRTSSKGVVQ